MTAVEATELAMLPPGAGYALLFMRYCNVWDQKTLTMK